MLQIHGKGVSNGMARGILLDMRPLPEKTTAYPIAQDPTTEHVRFRVAWERLHSELVVAAEKAKNTVGTAEAEIFTMYQLMLTDEDFLLPIEEGIDRGMSAIEAVQKSGTALAEQLSTMDDPYLCAREADIRSLTDRLTTLMTGKTKTTMGQDMPPDASVILLARELSPTETLELDTTKVVGIVTEQGSTYSHAAILARTLGIPAIAATGTLSKDFHDTIAIIDGEKGILFVSPDATTEAWYTAYRQAEQNRRIAQNALRGHTCTTKDGHSIQICANVGGITEVQIAVEQDAEGIGLFRSEFLFMQYDRCPTEDEQYAVYRAAVEAMPKKTVVIRTLDAGADKPLPWLQTMLPYLQGERNPALGLRAVRIGLQCPMLLRTQLRALYRAANHGSLAIMLPMITLPSELAAVQTMAAAVRQELQDENISHDPTMPIGIMIETPSAALLSEELAKMAAFFSIGTNDLTQYTMAADRENDTVAYLTETVPDSVKRLLHRTIQSAHEAGIPVGVCGEMAADRRMLSFWVNERIDKLSVSPNQVLPLRTSLQEYLDTL